MAAYDAIASQAEHAHLGPAPAELRQDAVPSANGGAHGGADAEALQEQEALQRIEALVERMREMETWFEGVKAEAERERRMREQAVQRLALLNERLDRSNAEMSDLRAENASLRERLEDLSVAQEEAREIGGSQPTFLSTSMSSIRAGADAVRGPII